MLPIYGRRLAHLGGPVNKPSGLRTLKRIQRKEGLTMDVIEFITVLSLVLTAFALGYTLGKDHNHSKQK